MVLYRNSVFFCGYSPKKYIFTLKERLFLDHLQKRDMKFGYFAFFAYLRTQITILYGKLVQ